jgi:hypothetical protein
VANRIELVSNSGSVLSAGALRAADLGIGTAADIALNDASILGNISLIASGGSVSARNLESDGAIDVGAGSGVSISLANATSFVRLASDSGGVTLGSSDAGSFVSLTATGGDIVAGALVSGSDISLQTFGGSASATSLVANRDVEVIAPGAVTLGTVSAGDDIRIRGASVTATSLVTDGAGPDGGGFGIEDGGNVDVGATLAVTVAMPPLRTASRSRRPTDPSAWITGRPAAMSNSRQRPEPSPAAA